MNRQSFAYGMRALALVQNEGVMSSPSDIMVIGGQKTAARQQNNLVGCVAGEMREGARLALETPPTTQTILIGTSSTIWHTNP